MKLTGDELITVQDAIDKFGYSRDWLAEQVRAGKLPAAGWVSRLELERLVQESLEQLRLADK